MAGSCEYITTERTKVLYIYKEESSGGILWFTLILILTTLSYYSEIDLLLKAKVNHFFGENRSFLDNKSSIFFTKRQYISKFLMLRSLENKIGMNWGWMVVMVRNFKFLLKILHRFHFRIRNNSQMNHRIHPQINWMNVIKAAKNKYKGDDREQ